MKMAVYLFEGSQFFKVWKWNGNGRVGHTGASKTRVSSMGNKNWKIANPVIFFLKSVKAYFA